VSSNFHAKKTSTFASLREPSPSSSKIQNSTFKICQNSSLFLTFPLFFTTSHQNHPKTTSLFVRISHFLTTFCHFLSLFQRISATFPLRFRANSAHFRNP